MEHVVTQRRDSPVPVSPQSVPLLPPDTGTQPVRPLGLGDLVLLLVMAAMMLFASWFRSRGRIFWGDEIMGWMVLRQDTWAHLLRVWNGGIDSSGIFFYVFARPWLHLFGPTELALHLFSAFGMALAFVLTWLAARRFYSLPVVAVAVPALFVINHSALWQLANGRTYGIVMSATALTCYALIRTSPDQQDHSSNLWLLLTALASVLLVGSHILGVLYWSAFFPCLLARDAWFRVVRPRLYLAALSGLTILLLSWKNIVSTTALGKPSFWTIRPAFRQLPSGFFDFSKKTALILLFAAILFAVLFLVRRVQGRAEPLFISSRATLYFLLAAFGFLALSIFAVSKVSTPIFVDRYMLPMLIGDIFLLCELTARSLTLLRCSARLQTVGMAIALTILLPFYRSALYVEDPYPQRDYTSAFLEKVPSDEPIVLVAQGAFVDMTFYHNKDRRFETPIDWQVQLDPDYGPGGVSGTHEFENFKTYGFYADQIRSTADILEDRRRFAVVCDKDHTLWMRRYLLHNPAYRVTELPSYRTYRIWQVDRIAPAASAPGLGSAQGG